ncbi:hypothetical protein AL013_08245 [Mariprofundus ferrooxydans]|nr:hypothetical protein AL013_08245 [Mariprofundus ferrooxydans]
MIFVALLCTAQTGFAAAPSTADSATPASASNASSISSAETVMQKFSGDDEVSPQRKITTARKHQILFLMGIGLLVLLLITGILGVSMVAFGKDVFLPHMIFAGLSLTLAIVHSATAIAWFWPW